LPCLTQSLPQVARNERTTATITVNANAPSAQQRDATDAFGLGRGRLRDLIAYGRKTFDLREGLEAIRDSRQSSTISTYIVAAAVFFTGLLRIRSFNALEPKLREPSFMRLVGETTEREALASADTMSRVLRGMDLPSVRALSIGIVAQAERNKVFREGWIGAMRYVALDGWEPISSYERHCDQCLVRRVKVKDRDKVVEREQYYHRYVVAMLIDDRFDLALDIEPLLTNDMRPKGAAKNGEHEGELTAAIRLLRRVKQTYGWIDAVVGDSLYANGPFLTVVQQLRMSAVVIAKKETDEPLKEALALWKSRPGEVAIDKDAGERLELFDCPALETLDTYDGKIRVVRARITKLGDPAEQPRTWCMLVTGKAASRLTPKQVLAVARARWHIENTAFHQWTTRWYFDHVFVHDGRGILALYWLFFAAFNLLTLFLYRQLRSYGRDRGKDVTRTISRLVDEMLDDLARLDASAWDSS
jgi:hypothetical protein